MERTHYFCIAKTAQCVTRRNVFFVFHFSFFRFFSLASFWAHSNWRRWETQMRTPHRRTHTFRARLVSDAATKYITSRLPLPFSFRWIFSCFRFFGSRRLLLLFIQVNAKQMHRCISCLLPCHCSKVIHSMNGIFVRSMPVACRIVKYHKPSGGPMPVDERISE